MPFIQTLYSDSEGKKLRPKLSKNMQFSATPDIFVQKIINYLLDDRKHVVDCVQLF